MGNERAGPAASAERIAVIDALRGFALLGILLANIPYWAGLPFSTPEQAVAIGGRIGIANFVAFFNFVLDGKFYTLFSLLFGLGFALQLDRLERRGADGERIYRRRMLALLAIGLVHLFFIWDGDILTLYALLGFLLPWFRRFSDRALILWAIVLVFVVPMAGALLREAVGFNPGAPFTALSFDIARAMGVDYEKVDIIANLGGGGWHEWLAWAASGPSAWVGDRLENWRVFKVFGTMLLGMLAGRYLTRGTLLDNRALLWKIMLGGFAIGFTANYFYAQMPPHSQNALPSMIGTLPQGMAYGAAFLLAWRHAPFLAGLAPVGRMALTNYLTHSVLCGILFYGFGFGMMGRIEILWVYGLALALYGCQIVFSTWWLSRHQQGPMEALWRRMTYG
ncbi:MAG: DUF418 domain-containing protein [Sphingobium sp.]